MTISFRHVILILPIFLSNCVTLTTAKLGKLVVSDYQTISTIEDIEVSYGNFQSTTNDDEFIKLKGDIIKTHTSYGVICRITQTNHMTQYILTERDLNKTRFIDYGLGALMMGLGVYSISKIKSENLWPFFPALIPFSILNAGGANFIRDKNKETIALNYQPRRLREKLDTELLIFHGDLSIDTKQIKTFQHLNFMRFETDKKPNKIDSFSISEKQYFIHDSIIIIPLVNSGFINQNEFLLHSENTSILNCKVLSWDKHIFWGNMTGISLSTLVIKWDLIDYLSKDILTTITDTVNTDFMFENESFHTTLLSNGIQKSLAQLLNNKEFSFAINKANNSSVTYNEPILISASEFAENKGELLQSTITLTRNGKHGSGFIISNDGYVLTSYNIVGNSNTIEGVLHDDTKKTAQVIRKNKKYNLALLKFDDNNLKPLKIVSDSLLKNDLVQKEIYTISTPADLSLNQSISRGIISAQRNFSGIDFFQINTSINKGSSGGPITLDNGDVIGIINSRLVGENIESVGFGIPIWTILEVLNIQFQYN